MTEERAEYHLGPGPAEKKDREGEPELWEQIILRIRISPNWLADQLTESQARAIVAAIRAKYPGIQ